MRRVKKKGIEVQKGETSYPNLGNLCAHGDEEQMRNEKETGSRPPTQLPWII